MSPSSKRPFIKQLFVTSAKRIEVGFYTSNTDKFLQARMVLREFGLMLRHFTSSREPYQEDYSLGKRGLLARAIDEIQRRLKVESLFFVEDTSVRIEALSSVDEDVPGMSVKEWFARTSFTDLDRELRQRSGCRDAIIKSDIALHVPRLSSPVYFHGETRGRVAETPPSFEQSDQCPWLSPHNFNGWFIPESSSRRLGEMSFEESWHHDFRIRALASLAERLEEYAAVLNLSPHSYSTVRPLDPYQGPDLFPEPTDLLIVVGRACAGKTTLGQYLERCHGYHFIEASSVVRMLANELRIDEQDAFRLASDVLGRQGPDIVARQIVGMCGADLVKRYVVTGFRTIEEIAFLRQNAPGCHVVFVEASERTRFERHLARGRLGSVKTLGDFQKQDKAQSQFGLLGVARELADVCIENEGTMVEYYQQIDSVIAHKEPAARGVSNSPIDVKAIMGSRLFRCLSALENADAPLSSQQISDRTLQQGNGDQDTIAQVSARHTNWILRDFPEFVRRIDAHRDSIRYELLPAGRAYLRSIRDAVARPLSPLAAERDHDKGTKRTRSPNR